MGWRRGIEPTVYTHYLYDASGNRVKKFTRTAGGTIESFVYIDGIIEYREDNNGNTQSITQIMDDTKRIASIRLGFDFGDSTPNIKYNLDDHLGSSNVLVDEYGTVVNFEEYYPFGETSFGSYAKKRYRFCGKEKDEDSGLYYYGARYYSPWLCRFVSVDPLAGKYAFYTPYQYAGNKPINFTDLDGMEPAPPNTVAASRTTTSIGSDVSVLDPFDNNSDGSRLNPAPQKHGDSKLVNGVTEYYDEYANKGKGGWSSTKLASFSKADVEKMKNYYLQNAKNQKAHESNKDIEYDDCITSMNNGVDMILGNSSGTLNTKAVGVKGTSVSETAKYLQKNGNVDSTTKIAMTLKPKIDPNTNQPITNSTTTSGIEYEVKMAGSITDAAFKMTGGKDGIYIFALSLMGGYHSMTLTAKINNGVANYFVSDQVYDWTKGWTSSPSRRAIDDFAKAFSFYNYPGSPKYKNTEIQLWMISK